MKLSQSLCFPALFLGACAALSPAQAQKPAQDRVAAPAVRPNVLFISIDDLRPTLGAYGDPLARTPNIDALAQSGTTFTRAYCQQALCSPSRVSLMTGLRPDTTRIYDLQTHFRTTIPDAVTLPQFFKAQGYQALAMGKIFHPGLDDRPSWSAAPWKQTAPVYGPEGVKIENERRRAAREAGADQKAANNTRGLPSEAPDVPDNAMADGATADQAVKTLREIGEKPAQPFFLAVGFGKPHLPFVAPKKYWDKWKRNDFALPATYRTPPKDVPPIAMAATSGEIRAYAGIPAQGPLSDDQALELIHGYYASTSYMDAQLGRVLSELDRLKLRQNTVVVLWSDHGYQLGDHTLWNKHTNFEIATRVPLIFSVPGAPKNQKAAQLAELVDIYPTLCQAAGLPVPAVLQGQSLLPIIQDGRAPGKAVAVSQYPHTGSMGYSLRSNRYRYTEWVNRSQGVTTVTGVELYDHDTDPGETQNIAGRPENQALVAQLSAQAQPIIAAGRNRAPKPAALATIVK